MRTLALNQNEPRSTKVQMSEAFITSVFLALSGGFQDAYTYFTRDGVFSNAQTGNVVLMSQHFMMGEWSEGLRYLFPLLAFAVGVFVAERIQGSFSMRESCTGDSQYYSVRWQSWCLWDFFRRILIWQQPC